MLVIRAEIPFREKKERSELAAESTFCHEFSAASLSSSKRREMQVGRDLSGICS